MTLAICKGTSYVDAMYPACSTRVKREGHLEGGGERSQHGGEEPLEIGAFGEADGVVNGVAGAVDLSHTALAKREIGAARAAQSVLKMLRDQVEPRFGPLSRPMRRHRLPAHRTWLAVTMPNLTDEPIHVSLAYVLTNTAALARRIMIRIFA